MDIDLIWTAAADWKIKLLALAIAAQAFMTIRLYIHMSKARMAAVKAGRITADTYKVVGSEPEDLAIFTRAIANQYELPVLFYAIIIGSLALGSSSWLTVILAFAFVLTRYLHAKEMITTNVVMRRRKLFIYSMQVFMLLLLEFVVSAAIMAQA